jgi:hypothetical protein
MQRLHWISTRYKRYEVARTILPPHLYDYPNTEPEIASMTLEDCNDLAFPTSRVEGILSLQYEKFKNINLSFGGVAKPLQGRDAVANALFKSKVEEHVASLIMQLAFDQHSTLY